MHRSYQFTYLQGTSSNNLYFARKFEPVINQAIINQVEEWVYGPPTNAAKMLGYWQSIYHYADLKPVRYSTNALDHAFTSSDSSLNNFIFVKGERLSFEISCLFPPVSSSRFMKSDPIFFIIYGNLASFFPGLKLTYYLLSFYYYYF